MQYTNETKGKILDYLQKKKLASYSELRALGKKDLKGNKYMYNPRIDFNSFEAILKDLEKEKKIEIKEFSKRNKIISFNGTT